MYLVGVISAVFRKASSHV